MVELIWDGKYDKDGKKRAPVRVALPFQTVETVNESTQDRQRSLELFGSGRDPEWRNRLIWGDKKYVLPSLLPEFAGKVDLIYIDPPFDTGADFSYTATLPGAPRDPEDGTPFEKEPSILEQKAYRDTWGGLGTYLDWFCAAAAALRELLTEHRTSMFTLTGIWPPTPNASLMHSSALTISATRSSGATGNSPGRRANSRRAMTTCCFTQKVGITYSPFSMSRSPPHLAELYSVAPRVLVQAVKRNHERFHGDLMPQLTMTENANLKSPSVISSWGGARRAVPPSP